MQNFIFLKGFFLSLSLIMAIGAQNAFVLRQGIAKNNVFYVCLVCFLCDFVLILAGIFGVGEVIAKNVIVNVLITVLGILFVSYYAITALISAFSTKNSVIFEIEHSNFSIKKNYYFNPLYYAFKSTCLFRYCFCGWSLSANIWYEREDNFCTW